MAPPLRLGPVLVAAVLALPVAASAQSAATAPATPQAQQQTLRELQRQAARLTAIARLPQADRAQATSLLDRFDALRQRAVSLRIQELRAYVDALKGGTAAATARAEAQQTVSAQRVALAKDEDALRSDAQTFLQKVPQARALLRALVSARGGAGGAAMGACAAPRPGNGQHAARGMGDRALPGRAAPGASGSGRFDGPWSRCFAPGPSLRWGPWSAPWGERMGGGARPGVGAPRPGMPGGQPPSGPQQNGAPPTGGATGM